MYCTVRTLRTNSNTEYVRTDLFVYLWITSVDVRLVTLQLVSTVIVVDADINTSYQHQALSMMTEVLLYDCIIELVVHQTTNAPSFEL